MDRELLEQQLSELPLYVYYFIDPNQLEFSERIRYICQAECPMYGKTWACPPAVGSVEECAHKCQQYQNCLMIGTITETDDVPSRMHPCVESHGINLIPTMEAFGLDFQYGDNIVTWYSLLFFNE